MPVLLDGHNDGISQCGNVFLQEISLTVVHGVEDGASLPLALCYDVHPSVVSGT